MTTMARVALITIFTVLTGNRLYGNFNELIFRFTARHTCLHTQMDSLLIENLTSHENWMLYYPDTVITLISTSLRELDAETGELKIINYPNPFTGQTNIELFVPETDRFQIRIYDVAGRMASLFEDWLEQGMHKFTIYSGNQNVYLLSVSSPKYSKSLVLLQSEGTNGVKPRIAYDGRNMEQINQRPVNPGMRALRKSYDPSFNQGDEMRFTAFVTTHTGDVDQASIQDSPHESTDYTFDISNQVPALPSEIIGLDWVPGKTTDLVYEVVQEPGVNYLWSFPESWSSTDPQQSHQVRVTSGNQSGNLSVRGENTCGTGQERILHVKLFFTLNLEAEPAEGGTVTPAYAEIEAGEIVTIEAEPNVDWELVEWTGDVEGNETTLELTISDNVFAKAKFVFKQLPAMPSEIIGMDWVPGNTNDLVYEVIQEPGVDYVWSLPESWSFSDLQQSHQVRVTSGNQSGILSVRGKNSHGTGPERSLPVKVFFTLSLEAEPAEGGTVTPVYAEIEVGEKITIEAEPYQDWQLIEWTGDVEGNETTLELTISDNVSATAKFDRVKLVSIHVENPIDTLVISRRHKFRVTGTYSNGDTTDLTDATSYRGITDKITLLADNTMVGAKSGMITVGLDFEDLSTEEIIYVYEVEFVDIDNRFKSSNDDCALRVPILIINYFPTNDGLHHDQSVGPTGFWDTTLPVVSLDAVKAKVMEDFIVSKQIIEYGTRFRDYGSGNAVPYICMDVVKYINVYEIDLVPWVNNLKTIDYHKLFLRLGIENLVVGHGVKEIWMSIFPKGAIPSVISNGYDDPSTYYDFPESNMSSPTTGDISNSWRIPNDLPVYSSTYVVYGHNNHRGVDTFLHNRGHQIEVQMHYIERDKVPGKQLFWNQFIGLVNGVYTQRCGNTHFPPNGEHDYDYANQKIVYSDIQNWLPAGGQKSPVNVDTWTKIVYDIDMRVNRFGFYMDNYHNDPHTKWLLYWFQSIPGQNNNIPYQRDGKTYMLNNWWELFYNWDDAINNNLTLWNESEVSD